ncbi:hypothetical protein HAX54_020095 [Datura stramonium]|uniref:Enoyl reductase (ER) domain-containing protein n=1 Tax=Datura stramonium TaxID=4076 RepID=A0ABS8USE5_DATST|nr:hypothetical protein [Datura stramonium]
MINGQPTSPFPTSKGWRKEYELPPFFFVLSMEYLTRRKDKVSVQLLYENFMEFSNMSSLKPKLVKVLAFLGGMAVGTDVAREVVDVGSSVVKFKIGDKVAALLNPLIGGGLAEYAVAMERLTVARPEEVSAAEGVGLPIAALTAHKALVDVAGIKLEGSGQRMNILVTDASSVLGHYVVQLAKLGNAHVTGTCGACNIEFMKSLGADKVLHYKMPKGTTLKSPSGKKYDVVVHCARGIPWSTFEPNLSDNGKVIDLTPGPILFIYI